MSDAQERRVVAAVLCLVIGGSAMSISLFSIGHVSPYVLALVVLGALVLLGAGVYLIARAIQVRRAAPGVGR